MMTGVITVRKGAVTTGVLPYNGVHENGCCAVMGADRAGVVKMGAATAENPCWKRTT